MTLLALTLAVGIVIDDAIVVLENIYRFIDEKRMTPMQAAIEATREIGLAVLATTLSLMAVFVPVALHERHRRPLHDELRPDDGVRDPVSMLVSFTLTPMLSARWLKMRPRHEDAEGHERPRRRLEGFEVLPAGRSLLHRRARLVARAPLRSSPALPCWCSSSSVPLFMLANKNFLPVDDQSAVRGRTPRAGGHEPRRDGDHREPHRDARPPAARGVVTRSCRWPTTRRRRRTSAPSTSG